MAVARCSRPRYAERAWNALGSKPELTVEEVSKLMKKLNMRPTRAYAEEMLRIVDTNGDGRLQVFRPPRGDSVRSPVEPTLTRLSPFFFVRCSMKSSCSCCGC